MCFPKFNEALIQVTGVASFPSLLFKPNKISKIQGTRKVEYAYNF